MEQQGLTANGGFLKTSPSNSKDTSSNSKLSSNVNARPPSASSDSSKTSSSSRSRATDFPPKQKSNPMTGGL